MATQSNEQTIRRRGMGGRTDVQRRMQVVGMLLLVLLSACATTPPATTNTPATSAAATQSTASAAPEATSAVPVATAGSDAQQSANVYTDPQGRFSVPIPTSWKVEQRAGFVVLSDPEQLITAYALVMENADPTAAVADAWKRVDPTWTLAPAAVQDLPPTNGIEQAVATSYDTGNEQRVVTGRAQCYQGATYVLLFDADSTALQRRAAQAEVLQSGYTILAIKPADLRGVTPARVDTAITDELAAFTERMLAQYKVPGAAVAVVQDGKVVYINGFGVRNAATNEPLMPQTRMLIGSTGKSLTTMLMATLVDDGTMRWDTPAQQILPSFAVKDPELSKQITMRNLVCACTGVPRRDLELIFNANTQSAEDIVASLRSFELYTGIGEAFQYSNQMVASGGYIATVAAGHALGNLFEDYGATLKARVLDRIGMSNTTLSFADVERSGNYAVPHSPNISADGAYLPRPLTTEEALRQGGPAGTHWSTAEDMANYLLTELNRGVAPNGTRVVSADNLQETWQPQVPVDATTQYGLGWLVGEYKGQRLIHHGGNTLGFTSDFAFLPDANLGILVLANGAATNAMNEAIRARLWELVFAQPNEAEAVAAFSLQELNARMAEGAAQITDTVDVEAITPFVGRYTNAALGEMSLKLENNALVLDSGEFQSHLKPVRSEAGQPQTYIIIDLPIPGVMFTFTNDDAGKPTMTLEWGAEPYTFTKTE